MIPRRYQLAAILYQGISNILDSSRLVTDGAELLITRLSAARDSLRDYAVVVDGEKVASLTAGKTVTVPATPGNHIIQLKVDWLRSAPLRVTLGVDERVQVTCRAGGPLLASPYDALFRRNNYISLWVANDAKESSLRKVNLLRRIVVGLVAIAFILLIGLPVLILLHAGASLGSGIETGLIVGTILLAAFWPPRYSNGR